MKRSDRQLAALAQREVALAKAEAVDAWRYFNVRGRWPEGMSVRAWRYAEVHFPKCTTAPA